MGFIFSILQYVSRLSFFLLILTTIVGCGDEDSKEKNVLPKKKPTQTTNEDIELDLSLLDAYQMFNETCTSGNQIASLKGQQIQLWDKEGYRTEIVDVDLSKFAGVNYGLHVRSEWINCNPCEQKGSPKTIVEHKPLYFCDALQMYPQNSYENVAISMMW